MKHRTPAPSRSPRRSRAGRGRQRALSRPAARSIPLLIALCGLAPACGKRADLIARSDIPDMTTSCQFDARGELVITILNQGKREAKATTTEVVFGALPAIRLPTRPILPGESASVTFPVPDDCYQPECQFRITADANNEVEELDEGNNSAQGRCEAGQPPGIRRRP